jgi:hypothetical protein
MMKKKAFCKACGEPMPEGEEMFTYHGYSGPCPKPALEKPKLLAAIQYFARDNDGKFWLDIQVDGKLHDSILFDDDAERRSAFNDLVTMMADTGASWARLQ